MKIILVTGGSGFIGSNFIRYVLGNHAEFAVLNLDKLTYAGNPDNLRDIENDARYRFIKGDICDPGLVGQVFLDHNPDYVVNFAAESHVDRSIDSAEVFGRTNVMGTMNLMECARNFWSREPGERRFLQISTDEVYGSIENDEDSFSESSSLKPNSPYSASKAGADLMAGAFFRTYGLPVLITRCCNNYGPNQHIEKFIPTCITKALKNKPIPVYGDGLNVREWIHVLDHCEAVVRVLVSGKPGEVYNIGSGEEISNIRMAKIILKSLGKPENMIETVSDRPGHDRRYSLVSAKIRNEFGWKCKYGMSEGIAQTVEWYGENRSWWEKSGRQPGDD